MSNSAARQMRAFVARENIKHFDEILARHLSSQERARVEDLLAEEKRALDELDGKHSFQQPEETGADSRGRPQPTENR